MLNLPRVTKKKQHVLTLSNFSGGLNNRSSSVEINDNESPELLNVDFSISGAVSKRLGTALVGDDQGNVKVLGLHAAYYGAGLAKLLMHVNVGAASKLFYRTTGNWSEATGTAIANADVEFENFYDGSNQMTFFTDGTTYAKFNPSGTATAAATASPANVGTMLKVYKNRMYQAGSSTVPERVYFSDIGDGDAWTSGNYFDVPSQAISTTGTTGDIITAMAVHQDRLIIFKSRSIYAWDGNSLIEITRNHGCVGKRAYCQVENHLYFADNDGIYALSGNFIDKVSKKIQATWDVIPAARKGEIVMKYFNGKVYIATAAAGSSTNNIVLVNYPNLPQDSEGQHPWSYWSSSDSVNSPLAISCFAVYTSSTTAAPILVGGLANAQSMCIQLESGNADVTHSTGLSDLSINSYWKSKVFTLPSRHRRQFITYMSQSVASNLNVITSFDFDAVTSLNTYQMFSTGAAVYSDKAWVTSTAYAVNDTVVNSGTGYRCLVAHTSGTFATDLAAGKWTSLGVIGTTGVYDVMKYGGLTTIIGKGQVSERGKFFQFQIFNNAASQPWTVYRLQETYSPITLR